MASLPRKRGPMRRIADYTIGVVIVLVHLIMMSRENEKRAAHRGLLP